MNPSRLLGLALAALLAPCAASAGYQLYPRLIAADTYVVRGLDQAPSRANGGAILNSAFIVTARGVIVIDPGPSRQYGLALRAAIRRVSARPIAEILITHAHPYHFLGSAAFPRVPVAALPATARAIRARGDDTAARLYEQLGGIMRGTRAIPPNRELRDGQRLGFGAHHLRVLALAGHSRADLLVLDAATGVLFAGDLAYHGRAPETPAADLARWQASLARAEALSFSTLVPGHGPVTRDAAPLRQTAAYLRWLATRMKRAAAAGESAAELMFTPLPARWRALAVQPGAYRRSIATLYPAIERRSLRSANAISP